MRTTQGRRKRISVGGTREGSALVVEVSRSVFIVKDGGALRPDTGDQRELFCLNRFFQIPKRRQKSVTTVADEAWWEKTWPPKAWSRHHWREWTPATCKTEEDLQCERN